MPFDLRGRLIDLWGRVSARLDLAVEEGLARDRKREEAAAAARLEERCRTQRNVGWFPGDDLP